MCERRAHQSNFINVMGPLYTPIDDRALDSYRNQSEKMRILRGRCVCDWEDPLIHEEVDIYYYCSLYPAWRICESDACGF